MTTTEIGRLRRKAEECKERQDYAGFWKYRRAFLLGQAIWREEQVAARKSPGR